jgi:large subunit ribosomal protein L6
MGVNDPLGDMIARIHNAQMRNKSKVSTPRCGHVLDVLKTEASSRPRRRPSNGRGDRDRAVLRRRAGDPQIAGVSPAAGFTRGGAARQQRLGVAILSTPRASWRITMPATPTWAARFSARCSNGHDWNRAMSRVGKKPVVIPSGVNASVEGQLVKVKGPKGAMQLVLHDDVAAKIEDGSVKVDPKLETKRARAMWGTYRALLANLMTGVTKGFEQKLEINGVGYRAAVQGKNLQLALGYSHDVVYAIPEGITIVVPKPTEITITGTDSQRVGQVAAEIRGIRPPEPYKGKGVKYSDEKISLKEGKKK